MLGLLDMLNGLCCVPTGCEGDEKFRGLVGELLMPFAECADKGLCAPKLSRWELDGRR